MMKKKKRTTKKTPWQSLTAFAAALAMVVSMGFAAGITAEPSHAADSYAITGQYVTDNFGEYSENWPTDIKSVPTELKTTFSVYKVGYYTHNAEGKSVIMLDPAYIDKGIKLPPSYQEGDKDGLEAWMTTAKTISDNVQGDPVATADVNGGETFTLTVSETGLYLLVGTSAPIEQGGQKIYWRPQPMLVQVFDGSNRTVNVKPEAEIAQNFQVTKYWECADQGDKDLESSIRPKSINIDIYYDKNQNHQLDSSELYNTQPVVLSSDNSWTYTWSPKVNDYPNPQLWAVQEQDLSGEAGKYYSHSVTDGDANNTNNLRIFKLTNTFEPAKLELTKKLPKGFINHNDNVSTTFVFEITGYKNDDKIYHKYVSLVFDKDGNLKENSKTVKHIPIGLTKLVVKEVQAANYDVDKAEKTYNAGGQSDGITFANNTYTVEFSNTYNGTTHYSGGVINKFKLNDTQSGFTVDGSEGKTWKDKN